MDDTRPFGPPAAPPRTEEGTVAAGPAAGTLIAERYLIQERVAQGGMGAIYSAVDQRLQRRVALKMMLEAAARIPGFAQRFEREAHAASRVSHPNCVVTHDFGTDAHGPYLVLEWVEGRSLAALVAEEGPLPPERAAGLVAQVCDGLTAVHAVGIVHRDIKPENVMVTRTADRQELAKVVDFGIAREAASEATQLTQMGISIGSPLYMSPEQAVAQELDARSDLYSTGATLFFALNGRKPYLGDRLAVLQQLLAAEPPALDGPLASHPLAQVTRKAMAKSREARYQTAGELASAIRAAGVGSIEPPAPRPWRLARALPLALVLLVGLGLGAALWSRLSSDAPQAARYREIEELLAGGRAADAAELLKSRLEATPDDPRLQLLRGHLRALDGDQHGAREAYLAALAGDRQLAGDPTLQRNALEWLRSPNAGPAADFWRDGVGEAGLPLLREASGDPDRHLRWNAVRVRQQLPDPETPDVVAAALQDLAPARDCGAMRGAAEQLKAAGDPRGLAPLQDVKRRLNLFDAVCAGPVIDDAIRSLEQPAASREP